MAMSIPAGDPLSRRGQRPRNAHPTANPTLKGSVAIHHPDDVFSWPDFVRPLQGRAIDFSVSGGVAPGY